MTGCIFIITQNEKKMNTVKSFIAASYKLEVDYNEHNKENEETTAYFKETLISR